MAPDRGASSLCDSHSPSAHAMEGVVIDNEREREQSDHFPACHSQEAQNFTFRGVLAGLVVGLVICFSNMYFGLQTGWVSSMSMPSALVGFALFKAFSKHLEAAFTPVENVLVQTVAGSMGTMPLGCGLVGVMPALNYLLTKEEQGPIFLSLGQLILWCLGLSFFGVVFAVPLRRQVIIREKLKFPSGTATAQLIGVLHQDTMKEEHESEALIPPLASNEPCTEGGTRHGIIESRKPDKRDWESKVKLLVISFTASGFCTVMTYFLPILRNIPIFGYTLANSWLWTFNPSLAYVGQGIIMGPATTTHMLVGAIGGWAILSPLAKKKGWAPGPVQDWETGSKGWIVWISLAIMLADSVVSLGYISLSPSLKLARRCLAVLNERVARDGWKGLLTVFRNSSAAYAPLGSFDPQEARRPDDDSSASGQPVSDAPPEQLVSIRTTSIGLVLSIIFCIVSIRLAFGAIVPFYATVLAVLIALILSIMGVRALGETDLNPVSGISKLAQLFFALIIPQSNKNSVVINLIAGAVSEAGALQAGDLMQDLKTGHLLGAAPSAQFWGQIIGSAVGAVFSALIYDLYTRVYPVPGDLFQVPTGYVWIFTARLVTGKGVPEMAWQWAVGASVIFAVTTGIRILFAGNRIHPFIPGGIAVAVGMYNVPSFTLARSIGGLVNYYWTIYRRRDETQIVVLASGLILGEGVMSIVNLVLATLGVPHL